jgi:hypothetical protein
MIIKAIIIMRIRIIIEVIIIKTEYDSPDSDICRSVLDFSNCLHQSCSQQFTSAVSGTAD